MTRRFLGITVLADYILSEGVDAVIGNLLTAGATAVACNPTVTAPAPDGVGTFQPPSDAGTSPRLFDRPLFGRRALWVQSGPSFHPRAEFYENSPYGHRKPNALTDEHGPIVGEFIRRAADAGLQVWLQVGAAQPTGLRDEDRPRLPDGTLPAGRMADTASLASAAVRAYNHAYCRNLLAEYPEITGLRIDWPESPCYTFGEVFQDFSTHVEAWAARHGRDFDPIRDAVAAFRKHLLGGLSAEELKPFAESGRGLSDGLSLLMQEPGLLEWLQLKRELSLDLLRDWREALDKAGGQDKAISAHAFMPAYSLLTGFDFFRAARYCTSVSPKLYTMHWSQMMTFWGEEILKANPHIPESLLVEALVNLLDLDDSAAGRTLADYGYPEPDEPHPVPDAPQQRKLRQVMREVAGTAEVWALVHGYGPADDFARRLKLVADSAVNGVWLNRYGYLSDEKLRIVAETWR